MTPSAPSCSTRRRRSNTSAAVTSSGRSATRWTPTATPSAGFTRPDPDSRSPTTDSGGRVSLTRLVLRRLALGVLTLFLISLVVFAAVLALPGDAATAILGKDATPERIAALRDQLNLNDSIVSQYLSWIGGVLTGSFGDSAATQQPVSELLSDRVANTAFLVFVAAVVAIPLSIGIGVWTAMRRDRPVDHVVSNSSLVLAALPEFVIGIGLILLFATSVFHWFPAVSLLAPDQRAWTDPSVVVLPAATLVLAVTPYISRIMRGSMIEVLESEYVTMARLKGLSERTVIWRHAVPNHGPTSDAVFGADALGRDVFSRFLHGGLTVLWMSAAATALGVVLGTAIGLIAAYSRNWVDDVLMRGNDVVLAFPQIIFVLLAVSAIGPKLWLIVVTVGITHAPRVARVIRGAAQQIVERDFIKADEVAGERRSRIIMEGLLPNVTSPLLVELGLRMTFSIGLIAAISFLGFGLQPPTADWGLMINENRL